MTKTVGLLLILFFTSSLVVCQDTQWASKVIDVSSTRDTVAHGYFYQANQALGRPNKMPQIGESPLAWCPAKKKKRANEWIKVGFEKPIRIRQVAVAENWGAGTITQIYIYGEAGQKMRVYHDKKNRAVPGNGRVLNAFTRLSPFEVVAVEVILSTIDIEGWNQIDAIGISSSSLPIKAEINVAEAMEVESIEPVSFYINSMADETLPIVSADGLTLYFDRKNHPRNTFSLEPNDDIWYAKRQGDGWSAPIRFDKPLNNREHNYVFKATPDGNALLLGNRYTGSGGSRPGVSISHRTADGWGFPEPLEIEGYYNYNKFSEHTISNNRKVLVMAIERKDTHGGKDLYVSFLKEDGIWTLPKNMGSVVNSVVNELAPFIAADDKTLYFASSGFSNYGSNDIFMTQRLDSTWTNWSEPLNLGPTFNTDKWDAYFSLDAKGEYAYFVRAQREDGTNTDIYQAKLPRAAKPDPVVLISGTVYDNKTKAPIAAKVIYENIHTGEELGLAASNPGDGSYKLTLPYHQKYGIYAYAKGYFSVDDHIDLEHSDEIFREIKKDLHLVPIEVGQTIRLNNVFFQQSKSNLLPDSYPELKRLARMLAEHASMEITLEGHTDIVGNPKLNLKLSEERVKVVKEYLVAQGIDKKRIKTKAYGGSRPITRQRTGDAQKINRRVEVVINKI
ncbi:MAG: OmpA family protein [Flammeovirgaceae bacterium]